MSAYSGDGFDVAQVCGNGHMINDATLRYPASSKAFCPKCGSATMIACPSCQKPIRGYHFVAGVLSTFKTPVPSYCEHCGAAYPWTAAGASAARELAAEVEGLSDDERSLLTSSLDDLMHDTPATEVAAFRFRKLMAKGKGEAVGAFRTVALGLMTEAAKRAVMGQ
jgi:hypothetical protein